MQYSDLNIDKLLIQQIAQSNEEAFTLLFNKHWNKVYSHALRFTKLPHKAQEITQGIFIRVWEKRSLLSDVEDIEAYLFMLSKHKIISAMRSNLNVVEYNSLHNDAEETTQLPHLQLEHKQANEKLKIAIQMLPPARRRVFELNRLEGCTYDEVAQTLGISKNTVKEHISLALGFLKKHMHLRSCIILATSLLSFLIKKF